MMITHTRQNNIIVSHLELDMSTIFVFPFFFTGVCRVSGSTLFIELVSDIAVDAILVRSKSLLQASLDSTIVDGIISPLFPHAPDFDLALTAPIGLLCKVTSTPF